MILSYDELVRAAEAALVQLAVAMANGNSQSDLAFDLRETFACLEAQMDDVAVEFLRGLSSDLYSLEDDEIYDDPIVDFDSSPALAEAIYREYRANHWGEVIHLLRQEARFINKPSRAFLRGRAYAALNHFAAGWAFYDLAARINADRFVNQYFSLECLFKWDAERAVSGARDNLRDGSCHPAVQIESAIILLQHYQPTIETRTDDARSMAASLVTIMERASTLNEIPIEVIDLGYVALATCLDVLHDYANSAFILKMVAARDTNNAHLRQQIAALESIVANGGSTDAGIIINPMRAIDVTHRVSSLSDMLVAETKQALMLVA